MRRIGNPKSEIRGPESGFTLIELLVVMAILATLAAILVPIVTSARRMAKVTATKNLLGNVETAIGRFSEQTGCYPPDRIPESAKSCARKFSSDTLWPSFRGTYRNGKDHPGEALYYCLANPYLVKGFSPFIELQAGKESAFVDWSNSDIQAGDAIPSIVDRWDHPFEYNRKPFATGATLPTVFPGVTSLDGYDDGTSPKYNLDTYDLWSPGPVGYGGVDWITNWK